MNIEIILVGIIVGIANFASRFGPLYLTQTRQSSQRGKGPKWMAIALGSIGIAAISAMLVVATIPPLIEKPEKSLAMLVGFIVLTVLYYFSKKMVAATLIAALSYGLFYTYVPATVFS